MATPPLEDASGNHSLPGEEKDVPTHRRESSFAGQELSKDLDEQAHAGIKRIEAVSLTWTKTSLIVCYIGYVRHCLQPTDLA